MIIRRFKPAVLLQYSLAAFVLVFLLLALAITMYGDELPLQPNFLLILLMGFMLLPVFDLLISWKIPALRLEREITHNMALGRDYRVKLQITHQFSRRRKIRISEFLPSPLSSAAFPLPLQLIPGQVATIEYLLYARQRGDAIIQRSDLLIGSQLGFWFLQHSFSCRSEAKVYPDFSAVSGYELLAIDHHLSQLGILQKPRRGQGTEFQELRQYRDGDSLRQIDWKATSRMHKLISREYQDERDQQVVLMIDSGRRLRNQDDELSQFDHALNSLLLLAWTALKQGDSVAMLSFGNELRWAPAIRGVRNISRLLNRFYDLYPGNQATDYLQAAQCLLQRQRKRSLVVFVSNLRDEDIQDLDIAIRLLKKHHLVLLVNIREPVLDEVRQAPIENFDDALSFLGARLYWQQRKKLNKFYQNRGLFSLDCLPQQLAIEIVNRYHAIKRAGYI